jgi:hypothetical protein
MSWLRRLISRKRMESELDKGLQRRLLFRRPTDE